MGGYTGLSFAKNKFSFFQELPLLILTGYIPIVVFEYFTKACVYMKLSMVDHLDGHTDSSF